MQKFLDLGIIQKQSISGTVYSYLGVLLGFVTTAIIFVRVFSPEEIGLLRVLVSYAMLFAQFAGLGINSVTVKMFPLFRDYDKKHHGYLGITFLVSMLGTVISLIALYFLKEPILKDARNTSELLREYFWYIVPLILFTVLFNIVDTYYRVLYNAVVGIINKEVIQRLLILLVVLFYYLELIDFHTTVILYVGVMAAPGFLLLLRLIITGQFHYKPDFSHISKPLAKEMASVGFFGIVSSYSGVLALNIDTIMVQKMLGLSLAGIYSITFFFGALILVPLRTMGKISSVVIADAWKRNDISQIGDIYKKSSISLTILGLLLLTGIWGNIDNVFILISDEYLPGKWVILIIGLANMVDISNGMSPQIILTSRHYKVFSYLLIFYVITIIVLNFLFIPLWGIIGAAAATLFSKILFNLAKFFFLYRNYKLQPFTIKFVYLIVIALVAYGASLLLPHLSHYLIDIIVRSLVIALVFMLPVYMLKISPEINQKTEATIKTILRLVSRSK